MNASPINPGPVLSANKRLVGEASFPLPSMRSTLLGWFRPMTIGVVSVEIIEGRSRETTREVKTSGLIQAGSPEVLEIKSDGNRSWENATLHTFPAFNVETNAIVNITGMTFRVVKKSDQSGYGFIRYELLQDFTRVR